MRSLAVDRRPVIALVVKSDDPAVMRKVKPYAAWIARGGGEVRIVSPAVSRPLAGANGVLLIGGEDVAPARYGETDRHCERINRERDRFELRLIRAALGRDLPMLAVCRGVQILAVALGGTLYQDLPAELDGGRPRSRIVHRGPRETDTRHRIVMAAGSRLAGAVGRVRLVVNSHHHQAVRTVPPRTTAVAHSADGVIEALEHRDHRFVLGVQWHPERWPHASSELIMRGFLAACGVR